MDYIQNGLFAIPYYFVEKYFKFASRKYGGYEGAEDYEICHIINPSTNVKLWFDNPMECKESIRKTLEGYAIVLNVALFVWVLITFLPKLLTYLFTFPKKERDKAAIKAKGDETKARNELNWCPKYSFEDLVKEMVQSSLI